MADRFQRHCASEPQHNDCGVEADMKLMPKCEKKF